MTGGQTCNELQQVKTSNTSHASENGARCRNLARITFCSKGTLPGGGEYEVCAGQDLVTFHKSSLGQGIACIFTGRVRQWCSCQQGALGAERSNTVESKSESQRGYL